MPTPLTKRTRRSSGALFSQNPSQLLTLTSCVRQTAARTADVGTKFTAVWFHEGADGLVRGATSASELLIIATEFPRGLLSRPE